MQFPDDAFGARFYVFLHLFQLLSQLSYFRGEFLGVEAGLFIDVLRGAKVTCRKATVTSNSEFMVIFKTF